MIPALVVTDLDGTLLDADGSLADAARRALERCRQVGVPVCPVTSKTSAELVELAPLLGGFPAAGFENGAGVCDGEGHAELLPAAIPMDELREALAALRRATSLALPSVEDLDDDALSAATCLPAERLAALRRRQATLPFLAPATAYQVLHAGLPRSRPLQLVRGNRFFHLQGPHTKADVLPHLVRLARCRAAPVVACGDSPNDLELLARADVRIIVPGPRGPHPTLCQRFPDAHLAPHPHGRGWAAVVASLLAGDLTP